MGSPGWASSVVFTPPRSGAPQDTRGGASRGNLTCAQTPQATTAQFMLLTPSHAQESLTVSERPTLFAYIPPTSAQKAFFSLNDDAGKTYYQTTLRVPQTGGIVSIRLPDTMAPLQVGKSYRWGVAILCAGKLRPDSPFISSWIQRTLLSPQLLSQAQRATALDRAALYGKQGVWYDTLTTLAKLKRQQPNDRAIANNWLQVLKSVGLEGIAEQPFAN
jgi:hypothetical protein